MSPGFIMPHHGEAGSVVNIHTVHAAVSTVLSLYSFESLEAESTFPLDLLSLSAKQKQKRQKSRRKKTMCILYQYLYHCGCVAAPGDMVYGWCANNPQHLRITDSRWCPQKYQVARVMLRQCNGCDMRTGKRDSALANGFGAGRQSCVRTGNQA